MNQRRTLEVHRHQESKISATRGVKGLVPKLELDSYYRELVGQKTYGLTSH